MIEELIGKEALVQIGTASSVTDRHKGTILKIGDSWLQIKTKKKMVYVNLDKIGSISTTSN